MVKRIFFIVVLISVLQFNYFVDYSNLQAKVVMFIVLLLVVICMSIFLSCIKERKNELGNKYLTIANIFVFSYIVVHFQSFADYVILDTKSWTFNISSPYAIKTAVLSLIGLVSFIIGNVLLDYSRRRIHYNKLQLSSIPKKAIWVSSALMLVFLLYFIYYNGAIYLSGGYNQATLNEMQGSMSIYSVLLLNASMFATTFLNCIYISQNNNRCLSFGEYAKKFNILYYSVVVLYLSYVTIFGDRGPIFTYVMCYFCGYLIVSKKKIQLGKIIVIAFVAGLTLSILGIGRHNDISSRWGENKINEYTSSLFEIESISPITSELAGSSRTAVMAIENIPDRYPYFYGYFTLRHLINIIPFSSSFIDINPPFPFSSSSSFCNYIDHGFDNSRAGVGSSTIADIYCDFGVIGIVVVLIIIGYFFSYLDYCIYCKSIRRYSLFTGMCVISFFAFAIYLPRSMFLLLFRSVVWNYVFLWVLYRSFRIVDKKVR